MSKIIHPVWQKNLRSDLPVKLKNWLTDSGSFMSRLAGNGVNNARIQVLSQTWSSVLEDEMQILQLKSAEALVREVFIKSDHTLWMFARTVFPPSIFEGETAALTQLQNQSLGSVLFNYQDVQRSAFEFYQLENDDYLYPRMKKLRLRPLWARRSVFTLPHKSLLLIEIFTPEILTL